MWKVYPSAGLNNYLFGSALTAFGENRLADKNDALAFLDWVKWHMEPSFHCNVVDEYFSDHPAHRWRVMCASD